MLSKIRDPLQTRRSAIFAAGIAAGLLSMTGPAQAQNVSTLRVDGSRPTSMTVRIVGLDYPAVRQEVRKTAQLVCRNAMKNGELYAFDLRWCAGRASSAALDRYRSAVRSAAASGEVRTASLTIGMAEAAKAPRHRQ